MASDWLLRLAIIKDEDGLLLARALLWYATNRAGESITYMDRAYGVNDNFQNALYSWADKNGYSSYRRDKGKRLHIEFEIDRDRRVPYFDTFYYYDENNRQLNTGDGTYFMQRTDGAELSECREDRYYCENCDTSFDDEDDVHFCEDVQRTLCCDCCCYSDYEGRYISSDNASWSNRENTYFTSNDDEFVWVENDYYLAENTFCCEDCGEDFLRENAIECEDGSLLCEDCAQYDTQTEEYYTRAEYDKLIEEREAEEEREWAEEEAEAEREKQESEENYAETL